MIEKFDSFVRVAMEWYLILLLLGLVHSSWAATPTTRATFTITIEYGCRDWNADFPNICQSPKYNLTQPIKLNIDGVNNDIWIPCNYVIGKGYGKGQHLSTFIYHVISRISGSFSGRRFNVNAVEPDISLEKLFEPPHIRSKPHFEAISTPTLRHKRSSFSDLNITSKVEACGVRYDKGRSYRDFTSCPPDCIYCLAPERRFGQLLRWHEGDGICLRPQKLISANYWCIPGMACPDWFKSFDYVYLTNSEDDDNPCFTPAVSHTDGDVTRLTCVPHS